MYTRFPALALLAAALGAPDPAEGVLDRIVAAERDFLERLEEPGKRWKFSMGDVAERRRWDQYMAAYEDMIRNTSTPEAPWYVIPTDRKWFAQLLVAAVMVDTLEQLDLQFPKVDEQALREMAKVRKALQAEQPEREK